MSLFSTSKVEPSKIQLSLRSLHSSASLRVLTCTWNMHGKAPPSHFIDAIEPPSSSTDVSVRSHHLYAFGTEECGAGIASSLVFNASSDKWLGAISEYLGADFGLVAQIGLGAIHLAVFAHKDVFNIISDVQTGSVATGFANTIGNKGGVAVSFNVGSISMLFVNCHLAAHQSFVERRNEDLKRIERAMSLSPGGEHQELLLKSSIEKQYAYMVPSNASSSSEAPPDEYDEDDEEEKEVTDVAVRASSSSSSSSTTHSIHHRSNVDAVYSMGGADCMGLMRLASPSSSSAACVSDRYDRVFWMGDLNYRINLKRDQVDELIARYTHPDSTAADKDEALGKLVSNDQLQIERLAGRIFEGFAEGKLTFKPTYKLNKESDEYDSGPKKRVPSYTDRVLFKFRGGGGGGKRSEGGGGSGGILLRSYSSIESVKTSDHRPVVAQFDVSLLKTPEISNHHHHLVPVNEAIVENKSLIGSVFSPSSSRKNKKRTAKVTPL